jgi:hypothetical protein
VHKGMAIKEGSRDEEEENLRKDSYVFQQA